MKYHLSIKRIYQAKQIDDGYRVLVDRLWPRGVSKSRAALDEWNKEVTPSPDLRKWFGHKPERFDEFKQRYRAELDQNGAAFDFVKRIADLLVSQNVTLLYAAKDPHINHAIILQEWIEEQL